MSFLFFSVVRVENRCADDAFFIFSVWRGLEARRPDTLLASDVRGLAVPFSKPFVFAVLMAVFADVVSL
jgi:hypothetical protein